MDAALTAKLQKLADREEIIECLTRYCRGMDRLDADMVRSCFHPDARDLHGARLSTIDELLEWVWVYHSKHKFHQHYVSNFSIDIDDDAAHAETYYRFIASYAGENTRLYSAGGRYIDRFERRNGEWRIASRICNLEWHTKQDIAAIIDEPINTDAILEDYVIARSREDASYARPLIVREKP